MICVTISAEMNATVGSVVTVGTFDGVHLGHQAILQHVVRIAREKRLERVAYTFTFPPRLALRERSPQGQVSRRQAKPRLLLPELVKVRLLEQYVDRVERAEFAEVRGLPAEGFVNQILLKRLAARAIVVGESFRFGRDREGDVSLLRRVGEDRGILIVVVPPVSVDRTPVSSTRIRSLVSAGEVGAAGALLGRSPLLIGTVVEGDRLGNRLGYPTANLLLDPALLPPANGIYLVHTFWSGKRGPGILYVGVRPTLKGSVMRYEVHLLSPPDEELYGETMEVHLLKKLRDDRAFSSLEALRSQMDRDATLARSLLLSYDGDPKPILA